MLHFLDTSVCVSLIRGRSAFAELPPTSECAVSVITAAELEVGIHRSSRPHEQRVAVYGLLELFSVLALEASAVADYGEIRVELERAGTSIGPLDLLIAAHVRSLDATLVTSNVREFRRVKGLQLKVWK
jgi:tRNA(fMet)-specific endonuclease VapC